MSEISAEHCILAPDGVYVMHKYRDEAELERFLLSLSKSIFGKNTVYFDVKKKVESKAKSARITDGMLLDLNGPRKPRFWIVEAELSEHKVEHVQNQILGFFRALRDEETIAVIRRVLDTEIEADRAKAQVIRRLGGSQIYKFIDQTLHSEVGVVVVIDTYTPKFAETLEDICRDREFAVIELKTYQRGKRFLHSFNPFLPSQPSAVRAYTVEDSLSRIRIEDAKQAFRDLRDHLLKLEQVSETPRQLYVSYISERTNRKIAELEPRTKTLWLYLNLTLGDFASLGASEQVKEAFQRLGVEDCSQKGTWATGKVRAKIENPDEARTATALIDYSHRING
jgi:predicted transport protein